MTEYEQLLSAAADVLGTKIKRIPRIVLVLGSGLGDFAATMEDKTVIPFAGLPGFRCATAPGHEGNFVFGRFCGVEVAVMQGRLHYYEGWKMEETVFPLRVLRRLGAEILLLTNAVGAIRADLHVGDFLLIQDHISSFIPSPLRGPNPDTLGPRFPDMSAVYDPELRRRIHAAADAAELPLSDGVLLQTPGPQFESPSEIRFFRTIGADAVGMSSVSEAIAGRHCGYRVCTLSWASNLAAGIQKEPITLEEVQLRAGEAVPKLKKLLSLALPAIADCR